MCDPVHLNVSFLRDGVSEHVCPASQQMLQAEQAPGCLSGSCLQSLVFYDQASQAVLMMSKP